MRPYRYRCNDHSLLTPAFKRFIVAPLIRFVPWAIPANIITFIANIFVYLSLYFALSPGLLGIYTRLFVAVGLLLYLIGDHLDGMQAKRTGTGSALGEFCDHYLDAFNNGIILFTFFSIFQISNPLVIAAVIFTSYLAHMAVFYEQFKTGWLTFERMGSLEGVLFSSLLIGLSAYSPLYTLLTTTVMSGFTVIEIVMLSSASGAVLTFLTTYKRTPDIKIGFWLFVILLLVVSGFGVMLFTNFQLFTLLTLYASLYIGRVMRGHLVDGIERHTDWVTPAAMVILYVAGYSNSTYSFWLLTTWLSTCIGYLIVQTFNVLKVYWVWVNVRA